VIYLHYFKNVSQFLLAEVYVVGSGSKLGSWSPDVALPLTTGPQVRVRQEFVGFLMCKHVAI